MDSIGSFGVRFFFVISGFLITGLLLQEFRKDGGVDLARFYLRRSLRIFPAFYAYLAVLGILALLNIIELQRFDLLRSMVYIVNYYPWDSQAIYVRHIWSLSNEEQFYLLWPCCLLLLKPRGAAWLAAAVIVLEPAVRGAVMMAGVPVTLTIDRRFDCLADALATGCLLACLGSRLSEEPAYLRFLRSPWFFGIVILTFGAAFTHQHPRVYYLLAQTVLNIGIAIIIDRWVRFPSDGFGRLLNSVPMRKVGVMSYSIYLWQELFLVDDSKWWHAFPVNLLLVAAAAFASYHLVELPFQRIKSSIAGRTLPAQVR
jgi:peptidoglycan/LPS O-acetylase OafA/YrhL